MCFETLSVYIIFYFVVKSLKELSFRMFIILRCLILVSNRPLDGYVFFSIGLSEIVKVIEMKLEFYN